jgi:hypothetical protein
VHEILLGPKVALGRLHRSVTQQQLDLLQLSSGGTGGDSPRDRWCSGGAAE